MPKFLLALCVLLLTTEPAGRPTDVGGWNGAKWGMTVTQVKSAIRYPIERNSKLDSTSDVQSWIIPQIIKVGSTPLRVSFEFHDNKLTDIDLGLEDDDLPRSLAFDDLKQALIEKYGRPSDESRTEAPDPFPAVKHKVLWTFPSTSITLNFTEFGEGNETKVIFVNYRPVDKGASSSPNLSGSPDKPELTRPHLD